MKEKEIRPTTLFDELLASAQRDIELFFADRSGFVPVPCPACGDNRSTLAFEKLGFCYQQCQGCDSLYVSPRATPDVFEQYMTGSEMGKFFKDRYYQETADRRREKIYRPRAQLVAKWATQHGSAMRQKFVDVGCGFGIFLEEMAQLGVFQSLVGIEPDSELAEASRRKGFPVIEKPAEAVEPAEVMATFATAFEVMEHVLSPQVFLKSIYKLLRPGGLLLFTTLTISGFDLQVLWKNSKSICPPPHINLLSVKGYQQLVERCGFEVVELSTPGELDVDIVRNALAQDETLPISRFVRYLIKSGSDPALQEFQTFLKRHNLSSHIHVLVRRPDEMN